MSELTINEHLISKLSNGSTRHDVDGVIFEYLGRGGDGIVYKFKNSDGVDEVIKIYTKLNMNAISKEFFVVGLLQDVNNVNKNVVKIYRYYLSFSHPVMLMELLDGDLTKWYNIMVNNKDNLSQADLDREWLSMIFQVTYGLTFLNKLGILHTDAKAKNILFKTLNVNDPVMMEYVVEKKTYSFPSRYQFKIADFNAVQILGSTLNDITDDVIEKRISARDDFHELSRILYRILVDYGKNDYGWEQINSIMSHNKKYSNYYKEQSSKLDKDMGHLPKRIRNSLLLRALIYYGIENDYINGKEIIDKYSLIMPSKFIEDILDNLMNVEIDIFSLFKNLFLKNLFLKKLLQ